MYEIEVKDLLRVYTTNMKFCEICNNMYYLKLAGTSESDKQNHLVYYCRNCGHEDAALSAQGICALETRLDGATQSYTQKVNKYTRDDPTLPRTRSVRCPRSDCPSHKGDGNADVIYMRYDDKQIKYLYVCTACEAMWKTSNSD